jgi:hypothetical protein
MAYNVGISTGFWGIGKDPALLGLAQKIGGLGATGGIRFVQIDIERIAEFYEPDVEREINRMKSKLGMYAGMHGDIEHFSVDTAEKQAWEQTHLRLCQTMHFAAKFGFFYVNYHLSSKPLLNFTEAQQRIQGFYTPVVDPWGRGIQEICKGNPLTCEEAKTHIYDHAVSKTQTFEDEVTQLSKEYEKSRPARVEEEYQRRLKQYMQTLSEQDKKNIRTQTENDIYQRDVREIQQQYGSSEFIFKVWLKLKPDELARYQLEDGEFGAFYIVANWMKEKGDMLWSNIAGNADPKSLYTSQNYEDQLKFHAAVVSKYIEGHVTVKDHPANKAYLDGMSIKDWCEKNKFGNKVYLLFENPEAGAGAEGSYRLFRPEHFYYTIKNINSQYVKLCIDFEHMVSQGIDPDQVLPKLPGDFGKMMILLHIGQPVPYGGTAHIPLNRGTIAQEQIYRYAHIFRQKGWKDGYMIFERGGGRTGSGRTPFEVFEDSVSALRQISKYLDLDIKPKDLPAEFFGITHENIGVFRKQEVAIREHAWDPLEGTLSVPEEKHTFLSGAAVARQKGQEWEKRKYR